MSAADKAADATAPAGFALFRQGLRPFFLLCAISAIVIIVFWVYYAGLIFILGGEVAQVYELRRVRRRQREVFTE